MPAQIVELVDVQVQAAQQVLNVYHYLDVVGTEDPAALVADYIANVLPNTVRLQSTGLEHRAIRYRQVYPAALLTHEFEIATPIPGTNTGAPLASCDALSFKWGIGDTTVLAGGFTGHIKRGGTRLAGPTEAMVAGNDVDPATISDAALWAPTVTDPSDGTWLLVVASFLDGADPRARQDTVQAYAAVLSVSIPAPSTQNTRKILRGRIS